MKIFFIFSLLLFITIFSIGCGNPAEKDSCSGIDCGDYGQCRDAVCVCDEGFTGSKCKVNINDCEDAPCLHGTCVDAINSYTCNCESGYTGKNCDESINCTPNPCQNEGVCIDEGNTYSCNCNNTGFEGNNCEVNINECLNNPCSNEATCVDGVNTYTCNCLGNYDYSTNCMECKLGYIGNSCSECADGYEYYGAECHLPPKIYTYGVKGLDSGIRGLEGHSLSFDSNDNIFIVGKAFGELVNSTSKGTLFISKFNNIGDHIWTKQYDYRYNQRRSISIDNEGDIYIAIGSKIIKLDNDGIILWEKSTLHSSINSIAIDSKGNPYVWGTRNYNDNYDFYLVKLDGEGNQFFDKAWGHTSFRDLGSRILIDNNDNIFLTGLINCSSNFNSIDGCDSFLTKTNSDGNILWSKEWGDSSTIEKGNGITIDSNNNIFITGFAGGALDNEVGDDIFLTKVNSEGDILWTKLWGETSENVGNSISKDSDDNLYVTGNASSDIFINKFDNNGELIWSIEPEGSSNYDEKANSILLDKSNNIFVTGGVENGIFLMRIGQ